MTSLRYLLVSLWHYRRVHLAVAAGVAVATAVMTGALLVGDSVRGSLRDLVLERLGRIDQVLVAEQPFRAALAGELACEEVAPLLFVSGTLTATKGERLRRATQLSVIGHTDAFWQLDNDIKVSSQDAPPALLAGNRIAISRSIAAELGVEVGDEVLLGVPLAGSMPAESLLGEKADTTTSRRLEIAAVLPDRGLARFSLRPSQQPPRNVFLPLQTLQKLLELSGRVNGVAIVGEDVQLRPTLEDFGVSVGTVKCDASDGTSYVRVTADRLVLPPALVSAFATTFPEIDVQPVITYLANTIRSGRRQIPYSTITGVDSLAQRGPLFDDQGKPLVLAQDEIVLNDWAAGDLKAKVGDLVTLTYYEPETTHGVLREAKSQALKIRAIVPLQDAENNRTMAGDARLTPDLPGVTDQRSMSDWDLPFELIEPIRSVDEDYWEKYSTTPKAFVSYALAKKLWSTRWGTDSVLRLPASAGISSDAMSQRVRPHPVDMGFTLLPVKAQGLVASRGTTAFEGLFLGFSFFLMASAVLLIALLFRLGAESRAAELGVLASLGWSLARLRRLWLGEGVLVAGAGALVGVVAGIGYARLMIHGLSTWWVAATVTPFLQLHVTLFSVALGFGIGMLVAMATLAWSLRSLLKIPARQLLTGDCSTTATFSGATTLGIAGGRLPVALIVVATILGLFATNLAGEAQAGAFFGSGALVLGALLIGLRGQLYAESAAQLQALGLAGLAARSARRNPQRTLLAVGLAAVASFLIVALSAFRLAPTEQGTGGFTWIATSDQPLHFDLNTSAGREELGFGSRKNEQLTGMKIFGFRVRAGEDASCLNLYQTAQPQILGVPASFAGELPFGWAARADGARAEASPWELLATDLGKDEAGHSILPIILDKNTALYSLHLSGLGAQMTLDNVHGRSVTLEVVGLLANSVLQGKLLLSEEHFVQLFPEASGQQFFLIRRAVPTPSTEELASLLAATLEGELADYGFDVVSAEQRLAGFLAVQNTYLSTFQSLGVLGLLLGTLGLAISQLRSVVERRSELALLRCAGFRRARLAEMILDENATLLLGGLGIGTLAALVAVLPHYFLQEAEVPWGTLAGLLLAVIVAGLLAGWLAVQAAVRAPLLPALRGD